MERFNEQEPAKFPKFPETKFLQLFMDFCSIGLTRIKLHLRNWLASLFPPCLVKSPFKKKNGF